MSLNTASAISYNQGRGYSQKATAIIQSFVNAKTTGVFDSQTVTAIYKLQQSPRYAFKFTADGKVGPNTLGLIIMEIEHVGKASEGATLRAYSYTIQGAAGDVNPVESFVQWTSEPLILRTDGFSWYSMQGVFGATLKLSANLPDPTRYEYRQKIRGGAWSRFGSWNSDEQWVANPGSVWGWQSDVFRVPADGLLGPGLSMDHWKEDGEVINGKAYRFGHRDQPKVIDVGLKDFYSPNQSGREYSMQDTFGIKRKADYIEGLRLSLDIRYMGCVIDTLKAGDDKVIFSKQWSYKCEDALT